MNIQHMQLYSLVTVHILCLFLFFLLLLINKRKTLYLETQAKMNDIGWFAKFGDMLPKEYFLKGECRTTNRAYCPICGDVQPFKKEELQEMYLGESDTFICESCENEVQICIDKKETFVCTCEA